MTVSGQVYAPSTCSPSDKPSLPTVHDAASPTHKTTVKILDLYMPFTMFQTQKILCGNHGVLLSCGAEGSATMVLKLCFPQNFLKLLCVLYVMCMRSGNLATSFKEIINHLKPSCHYMYHHV